MFAKLFSRITESSLMEEPLPVRYAFMMLLAMCDPTGHVIGTDVAIARRMNMPLDQFQKCAETLLKPDPDSNSKEEDGRRIVMSEHERGYRVVNYLTYRDMKTEENRREYMREYMRKRRESEAVAEGKQPVKRVNKRLASSTHAEEEAELTEERERERAVAPRSQPLAEIPTESEFIKECARYLVPEAFARDKFLKQNTEGWEKVRNWRSLAQRTKGWFEGEKHKRGSSNGNKPYAPNI